MPPIFWKRTKILLFSSITIWSMKLSVHFIKDKKSLYFQ
jgi:hypothetical protein